MNYAMRRLGVVMRPAEGDPAEALGVLNPGCARGRDDELYLFPRIVAAGNYSRIARARARFNGDAAPEGVERLGVVLEPEASWERHPGGGGVEDPRITRVDALGVWVMTYAAYGPLGARIGLAASSDLARWRRLGPVLFRYDERLGADFNLYSNKDAVLFPEPVRAPDGRPAFALLHRPTFDLAAVLPGAGVLVPAGVEDDRPSIWVSFAPVEDVAGDPARLTMFGQHRFVAGPEQPWENVKIGAGPPPLRTAHGWLLVYHGVSGEASYEWPQPGVRYCAGAMLLDADDVTRVRWRSSEPLLEPETADETRGIVPDVVFPTGADPRPDGAVDIYYGMADERIGVARLT